MKLDLLHPRSFDQAWFRPERAESFLSKDGRPATHPHANPACRRKSCFDVPEDGGQGRLLRNNVRVSLNAFGALDIASLADFGAAKAGFRAFLSGLCNRLAGKSGMW